MSRFKDQVIWITGASSGIGEGLTYALAKEGARLAISSRKEAELERVKANCPPGSSVLILPLDVTNTERMPALAQKVIDTFGFINILINNAGISQRSYVKDTLVEVDEKIMRVNYLGTVALTKAVLPFMLKQQFGHIVVISSVLAKFGVPLRSAYCASKHALEGFFDAMRAEVADDNITVTLINPGYVRTNVTLNALTGDGTKNNKMAAQTAAGMTPDEFAQKALRTIARKREEATFAGKEGLVILVKRFFPSVYRRLLKRIEFQ